MREKMKLTSTDMLAVINGDKGYLNNKGANLYGESTYYQSVEYYRLAAALGEIHAVSNLGYCYLYGRDIEQNTSLAIAYFTIAANGGDIDAMYKLGDIYGSDKWGLLDKEKSVYYYLKAACTIVDVLEVDCVRWNSTLENYPSLCFAMAREFYIDGQLITDLDLSYQFLLKAKRGYETSIANGFSMYEPAYQGVLSYLEKEEYNLAKLKFEEDCIDDEDIDLD